METHPSPPVARRLDPLPFTITRAACLAPAFADVPPPARAIASASALVPASALATAADRALAPAPAPAQSLGYRFRWG